jgi:hypothetical protein
VPKDIDISLPFKVFPNLMNAIEDNYVTFIDANQEVFPLISSRQIEKLPQKILLEILQNINTTCVDSNDASYYLLRVLGDNIEHLKNPTLIDSIQNVPLFTGISIKNNARKRYTLCELRLRNQGSSVFYGGTDTQIIKYLQQACGDLDIVMLSASFEDVDYLQRKILANLSIPEINPDSVARTILNVPVSENPDVRRALLGYLLAGLGEVPAHNNRRIAIRYLLHSNPQHIANVESLYMPSSESDDKTWNCLFRAVMISRDQLWRIVDNAFESEFSPQLYRVCGIQKISLANACELFRHVDLDMVDFSMLDDVDHRHILLDITDNDLLKKLPIYQRVGGGLVNLNEFCFLQSDFRIRDSSMNQWNALVKTAVVIKKSEDPVLLAKQKSLIPELDANAAIKLSLGSDRPSDYASIIVWSAFQIEDIKKGYQDMEVF